MLETPERKDDEYKKGKSALILNASARAEHDLEAELEQALFMLLSQRAFSQVAFYLVEGKPLRS